MRFRGHREGRMVDSEWDYVGDPVLKFNTAPRTLNSQYVNHDIQDTILTLLANSVRDDILLS